MSNIEKAALEWLEGWVTHIGLLKEQAAHARVIKAMLTEAAETSRATPHLPAQPTPEMLAAMRSKISSYDAAQSAYEGYHALYAYLTKPKTEKRRLFHPDLEWLAERITRLEEKS